MKAWKTALGAFLRWAVRQLQWGHTPEGVEKADRLDAELQASFRFNGATPPPSTSYQLDAELQASFSTIFTA